MTMTVIELDYDRDRGRDRDRDRGRDALSHICFFRERLWFATTISRLY